MKRLGAAAHGGAASEANITPRVRTTYDVTADVTMTRMRFP